jgi:large subunit ribosomal protein L23
MCIKAGLPFKAVLFLRRYLLLGDYSLSHLFVLIHMIDLVKYPVITEKAARFLENNQYTFDVDLKLTKTKIKSLIEELFEVKVIAVSTHRPPRKKRRIGQFQGYRPRYKRVLITLKPDDSIPLFPES